MSRLQVQRGETNPEVYTKGVMLLDNNPLCVTLEPGPQRAMHPAIPAGVYPLTLQKSGEVYTWMCRDLRGRAMTAEQIQIAQSFAEHGVPLLQNVPGRGGVEIHIGNESKDTLGCTLLGTTEDNGDDMAGSTQAYFKVYTVLLHYIQTDPDHTIEYINAPDA